MSEVFIGLIPPKDFIILWLKTDKKQNFSHDENFLLSAWIYNFEFKKLIK